VRGRRTVLAAGAGLALLGGLPACLPVAGPFCPAGARPQLVAELYFGRNIGPRLGVSDADWRRFVDAEATPRFPDGFTVLDAAGQYRDGARIGREPSKLLLVTAPDTEEARRRLADLAEAYKRRFRQQSVLTVTRTSCVSS
jgi:hypothetical protein